MPWVICVERKSKKTSLIERMFFMKSPIMTAVLVRTGFGRSKFVDKKHYWSNDIAKAMIFNNRRGAAKEAGRYKKMWRSKTLLAGW